MTTHENGSPAREERWEAITALFGRAVAMPPDERRDFVMSACGDDADLRAEVLSLLEAFDRAPDWFASLERTVAAPARGALHRTPPLPHADVPMPDAVRTRHRARLLHYEGLERLGAGGMGVVYRARDTRLDRWVALKFVSRERLGDAAARRRLVREARSASSLDHPGICTVYGIEEADGELCIAMAYCPGGTLKEKLAAGPFSVDAAIRVALQISAGLARAHSSGLVHRDLKPANIGFSDDGHAKLLDFGLSVRDSGASNSDAGRAAGTLAYMAPEQLRGEAADPRADVWSLGVTLFEMLAGRRPFDGPDDAATMFAIMEREPPRLDGIQADVPPRLAQLVAAMLQRDRAMRPADGRAVHYALEALASDDRAEGAPRSPATQPPRLAARRRRWLLGSLAVVAVLSVAALAWRSWSADLASAPETNPASSSEARLPVAVLPFTVRGDAELGYLREGMVDLLSATLDGVGGLRGVDPNAVLGVAAREAGPLDLESARRAAARLGASRYVLGSIVQVGEGMQLIAALYDAAGAERARARTVVPAESALVSGVDDLARQLVASELTSPGERLGGLAAMTTHSLPALRAYLEGERLLRDARPEAAIGRFGDAVALDSMFALAWYRLARAAGWRQMDSLNSLAAERARQHADALPPRVRRIVDAYYHLRFGDPREAERRLRAIVDEHPDDAESWMLLGETLFHNNPSLGRPTAEAREPLQRAMLLDPSNREVSVHLMDLAAHDRRLGALDTLFRMYFSPTSDGEEPGVRHAYIALHARLVGDRDAGDAVLSRLQDGGTDAMRVTLTRIAPQLDDPEWSIRLASLLASPANPADTRVLGLLDAALLEVARGRWRRAEDAWHEASAIAPGLATMSRAWAYAVPQAAVPRDSLLAVRRLLAAWRVSAQPLDPSLSPDEQELARLFLIGLLSTRLGDETMTSAMRRRLTASGSDSASRRVGAVFAAALLGHDALARGQSGAALAALQEAVVHWPFARRAGAPLFEQHLERFARAEALLALGRYDDALRWYESLHDGYYLLGTPFLGASLARRAEIFTRQGRTEEARRAYRELLLLWRDAEPAFADRIRTVEARLRELQG
jgi:serine/threonine-protein kinase